MKMKWQIAKLIKAGAKEIEINEEVDFTDAVKRNPDIRGMSNVLVTGKGTLDRAERRAAFDLIIQGEMTLACALTLDDVSYPFQATLNPVFIWDEEKYDEDSEDYLAKDTIELASVLWQEIFIQIPLRIVKEGAYDELARQGIEILTEEDIEKEAESKIDPRLEVLKGLKFEN